MPIPTTCPSCKAIFRLPDEFAGKKVKCQKCECLFVVPEGDGTMIAAGDLVPSKSTPQVAKQPSAPAESTTPLPPPELEIDEPDTDEEEERPARKERRRLSRARRDEAPARSGANTTIILLALLGFGFLSCFGCAGASGIWWAVSRRDAREDIPVVNGGMNGNNPNVANAGGAINVAFDANGDFVTDNAITVFDPVNRFGKRHKPYSIRMEAGKRYQIDLISGNFDAYLFLIDDANNVVAQDDDGGGDLNSLINFTPNRTGVYRIEATSLPGNSIGNYRLIVRRH